MQNWCDDGGSKGWKRWGGAGGGVYGYEWQKIGFWNGFNEYEVTGKSTAMVLTISEKSLALISFVIIITVFVDIL